LSESGTLADGVVLRPGERDRDADDADDDVDGRRRGAVSAGSWYVRADNAIRMGGGGVCTGGEVPWNAVWEGQTRVWRGLLQALVVVGGGGDVEMEGRRRRYSHCTGDGE